MRGPKPKPRIVCKRCNREAQPVREFYCKNCASVLVRNGELKKIIIHDTSEVLTDYQEQILNGLMLGDGCLYRRKPTHTPYLVVQRSQNDREYLYDNYEVFKEFCKQGVIDGEVFDKRTNGKIYFSKFTTRRCKVFDKYHNLWYPKGKKKLPRNLTITPLTAAIWFSDDGHVRYSSSGKLRLQLSTESFQEKDIIKLIEKIQKEIGISLTIYKNLRINGYGESARLFFKYIDKDLPKSMYRKRIW